MMKNNVKGILMLENLIGILSIIVTVVSIIVTVHSTWKTRDKEKRQDSSPPAKE